MEVLSLEEVDLLGVEVESDPGRPSGLHLSDVIAYMSSKLGLYAAYRGSDPSDLRLKLHLGQAFDRYMAETLLPAIDPCYSPHFRMEEEGVHMTPDGATWVEVEGSEKPAIVELKHTYFSARKGPEEDIPWWAWKVQHMGYLFGYDARYVVHWTLHACGNYAPPGKPLLTRRVIRYGEREIGQNWRMIMRNSEAAREWVDSGGKADVFK